MRDNKTIAGYGIWVFANAHPAWFRNNLTQLIQWLEKGCWKWEHRTNSSKLITVRYQNP